ncbi:uncharacterized protein LOC119318930 [Triticum dicoccoides]|uniref:uncharacterized protein LOC119318930 n=1 Tax=Triticum dicoccoides TaxID=85692 RepID=UPI000E7AE975|nr:uncharacterized protein LOC119318930 [Triticum dicoccoides]
MARRAGPEETVAGGVSRNSATVQAAPSLSDALNHRGSRIELAQAPGGGGSAVPGRCSPFNVVCPRPSQTASSPPTSPSTSRQRLYHVVLVAGDRLLRSMGRGDMVVYSQKKRQYGGGYGVAAVPPGNI